MKTNRLLALEAMRGIAAIIVTFYHFAEAFLHQAFPLTLGTPAFILFNGDAAVAFFFILSGSVNCRPIFRDASPWSLARSLIRRWPRLMVPAVLAALFSYTLFAFDLYHFHEAAAITKSDWLASMANGVQPGFQPSFLDALYQGAVGCFLTAKSNYVPPLWTMHYELIGSSIVMVTAAAMARVSLVPALGVGVAAALAAALLITPFYLPVFVVGSLVTLVVTRTGLDQRPGGHGAMLAFLAAALYLLSYAYPHGIHAWVYQPEDFFWMEMLRVGLQALGAVCLMVVCLRWAPLQRLASGPVAKALGELSLPIFLLHVPIYCSASSWVLVHASPAFGIGTATALAWGTAVALTLPASWVFARIDAALGRLVMTGIDRGLATLRRRPAMA